MAVACLPFLFVRVEWDGFDKLDGFDDGLDSFDNELDGFNDELDSFDDELDGFDDELDGFVNCALFSFAIPDEDIGGNDLTMK
jgi:hypothetical protein